MGTPFLTPLLRPQGHAAPKAIDRCLLSRALAADPALSGRASCNDAGAVILTGPAAGVPPASAKERHRWELHVRLRLAAEFGELPAAAVQIRWDDLEERI